MPPRLLRSSCHILTVCRIVSYVVVLMQASDINALFGFRLECIERMGDQQGLWAWQRINALFNWLPLAALIEDRIVCMHGGATPISDPLCSVASC